MPTLATHTAQSLAATLLSILSREMDTLLSVPYVPDKKNKKLTREVFDAQLWQSFPSSKGYFTHLRTLSSAAKASPATFAATYLTFADVSSPLVSAALLSCPHYDSKGQHDAMIVKSYLSRVAVDTLAVIAHAAPAADIPASLVRSILDLGFSMYSTHSESLVLLLEGLSRWSSAAVLDKWAAMFQPGSIKQIGDVDLLKACKIISRVDLRIMSAQDSSSLTSFIRNCLVCIDVSKKTRHPFAFAMFSAVNGLQPGVFLDDVLLNMISTLAAKWIKSDDTLEMGLQIMAVCLAHAPRTEFERLFLLFKKSVSSYYGSKKQMAAVLEGILTFLRGRHVSNDKLPSYLALSVTLDKNSLESVVYSSSAAASADDGSSLPSPNVVAPRNSFVKGRRNSMFQKPAASGAAPAGSVQLGAEDVESDGESTEGDDDAVDSGFPSFAGLRSRYDDDLNSLDSRLTTFIDLLFVGKKSLFDSLLHHGLYVDILVTITLQSLPLGKTVFHTLLAKDKPKESHEAYAVGIRALRAVLDNRVVDHLMSFSVEATESLKGLLSTAVVFLLPLCDREIGGWNSGVSVVPEYVPVTYYQSDSFETEALRMFAERSEKEESSESIPSSAASAEEDEDLKIEFHVKNSRAVSDHASLENVVSVWENVAFGSEGKKRMPISTTDSLEDRSSYFKAQQKFVKDIYQYDARVPEQTLSRSDRAKQVQANVLRGSITKDKLRYLRIYVEAVRCLSAVHTPDSMLFERGEFLGRFLVHFETLFAIATSHALQSLVAKNSSQQRSTIVEQTVLLLQNDAYASESCVSTLLDNVLCFLNLWHRSSDYSSTNGPSDALVDKIYGSCLPFLAHHSGVVRRLALRVLEQVAAMASSQVRQRLPVKLESEWQKELVLRAFNKCLIDDANNRIVVDRPIVVHSTPELQNAYRVNAVADPYFKVLQDQMESEPAPLFAALDTDNTLLYGYVLRELLCDVKVDIARLARDRVLKRLALLPEVPLSEEQLQKSEKQNKAKGIFGSHYALMFFWGLCFLFSSTSVQRSTPVQEKTEPEAAAPGTPLSSSDSRKHVSFSDQVEEAPGSKTTAERAGADSVPESAFFDSLVETVLPLLTADVTWVRYAASFALASTHSSLSLSVLQRLFGIREERGGSSTPVIKSVPQSSVQSLSKMRKKNGDRLVLLSLPVMRDVAFNVLPSNADAALRMILQSWQRLTAITFEDVGRISSFHRGPVSKYAATAVVELVSAFDLIVSLEQVLSVLPESTVELRRLLVQMLLPIGRIRQASPFDPRCSQAATLVQSKEKDAAVKQSTLSTMDVLASAIVKEAHIALSIVPHFGRILEESNEKLDQWIDLEYLRYHVIDALILNNNSAILLHQLLKVMYDSLDKDSTAEEEAHRCALLRALSRVFVPAKFDASGFESTLGNAPPAPLSGLDEHRQVHDLILAFTQNTYVAFPEIDIGALESRIHLSDDVLSSVIVLLLWFLNHEAREIHLAAYESLCIVVKIFRAATLLDDLQYFRLVFSSGHIESVRKHASLVSRLLASNLKLKPLSLTIVKDAFMRMIESRKPCAWMIPIVTPWLGNIGLSTYAKDSTYMVTTLLSVSTTFFSVNGAASEVRKMWQSFAEAPLAEDEEQVNLPRVVSILVDVSAGLEFANDNDAMQKSGKALAAEILAFLYHQHADAVVLPLVYELSAERYRECIGDFSKVIAREQAAAAYKEQFETEKPSEVCSAPELVAHAAESEAQTEAAAASLSSVADVENAAQAAVIKDEKAETNSAAGAEAEASSSSASQAAVVVSEKPNRAEFVKNFVAAARRRHIDSVDQALQHWRCRCAVVLQTLVDLACDTNHFAALQKRLHVCILFALIHADDRHIDASQVRMFLSNVMMAQASEFQGSEASRATALRSYAFLLQQPNVRFAWSSSEVDPSKGPVVFVDEFVRVLVQTMSGSSQSVSPYFVELLGHESLQFAFPSSSRVVLPDHAVHAHHRICLKALAVFRSVLRPMNSRVLFLVQTHLLRAIQAAERSLRKAERAKPRSTTKRRLLWKILALGTSESAFAPSLLRAIECARVLTAAAQDLSKRNVLHESPAMLSSSIALMRSFVHSVVKRSQQPSQVTASQLLYRSAIPLLDTIAQDSICFETFFNMNRPNGIDLVADWKVPVCSLGSSSAATSLFDGIQPLLLPALADVGNECEPLALRLLVTFAQAFSPRYVQVVPSSCASIHPTVFQYVTTLIALTPSILRLSLGNRKDVEGVCLDVAFAMEQHQGTIDGLSPDIVDGWFSAIKALRAFASQDPASRLSSQTFSKRLASAIMSLLGDDASSPMWLYIGQILGVILPPLGARSPIFDQRSLQLEMLFRWTRSLLESMGEAYRPTLVVAFRPLLSRLDQQFWSWCSRYASSAERVRASALLLLQVALPRDSDDAVVEDGAVLFSEMLEPTVDALQAAVLFLSREFDDPNLSSAIPKEAVSLRPVSPNLLSDGAAESPKALAPRVAAVSARVKRERSFSKSQERMPRPRSHANQPLSPGSPSASNSSSSASPFQREISEKLLRLNLEKRDLPVSTQHPPSPQQPTPSLTSSVVAPPAYKFNPDDDEEEASVEAAAPQRAAPTSQSRSSQEANKNEIEIVLDDDEEEAVVPLKQLQHANHHHSSSASNARSSSSANAKSSASALLMILNDRHMCQYFQSFVENNFDPDGLNFYNSVREFQQESAVPRSALKSRVIIERFISLDSFDTININEATRRHILSLYQASSSNPPRNLFDSAVEEVRRDMEQSMFPLFLQSREYAEMIESGRVP
eukprot:ANDGO_06361.mRNA.1 hypothetical protein